MAAFFWQVINWIKGASFLTWLIPALLAGAGLVTWFNSYYEPKGRSELLEARITDLEVQLAGAEERRQQAETQSQRHLAHYRTLSRTMDAWREEHRRRTNDADSEAWRDTAIPGAVADGLRRLPAEGVQPADTDEG